MPAKQPIDVMLTATDLEAARRFYANKGGLGVLIESNDFVTFGCGGDSRLVVTRTTTPSGEDQTKASWRVADVVAEVAELRARTLGMRHARECGHPRDPPRVEVAPRPTRPRLSQSPT
jgi:hypothetical protein